MLLGTLLPGLGHVYNRQFGRGLDFHVAGWGAAWLTLLMVRDAAIAPFNLVLAVPWLPVLYFYMSRSAFLAARQLPDAQDVKRRWPSCLAVGALLLTSAVFGTAFSLLYRPAMHLAVAGDAMAPTLLDGERVFLDMSAYDGRLPDPGDIVVLEYPEDRERLLLLRCIAIEGQIVTIEDGAVYVDGTRFEEPEGIQATAEHFGPAVVPDGHFFVLGDNRRVSADSRAFGPVPRDHLRGKAVRG